MKITCRISGTEFYSSSLFQEDHIREKFHGKDAAVHPLFTLPARSLLAKARKFGQGKYKREEERLLFLALLNATDSVIWDYPAFPSIQTVGRYVEEAFKLLTWYVEISPGTLKLPKLRVTELNYKLENVGNFFKSWYEVRQEWMTPASMKWKQDLLEAREFVIYKMIHSYKKNEKNLVTRLADWAMNAADVHPDRREEWTKIFCTSFDDIFDADIDELKDMYDWMAKELYAPGSYGVGARTGGFSAEVLNHVDKLLRLREGGRLAAIRGDDPSTTFKILSEEEQTGELLEDDRLLKEELLIEEQLRVRKIPEVEPKIGNYANRLTDYVRDRGLWSSAASMREDLEFIRNKRLSNLGIS